MASPVRPPRARRLAPARVALAAFLALVLIVVGAPRLGAQRPDSARAADSLRVRADTAPTFERLGTTSIGGRPPLSPRRAFVYSLLVPGLAQARLDRPNGGALFAAVELGAIVMAMKSRADLRYAERASKGAILERFILDTVVTDGVPREVLVASDTADNRYGTDRVRARRLHLEDWIAVLAFNHIFAGADAFVAAQLWDMPVRGSLRAIGPGTAVLGARIEFGGRRPR